MVPGRRSRVLQPLLLVGFLLSVTACSLFRGLTTPPQESPWYIGPEEVLWDATVEVVSQRYRMKDIDRSEGTFESEPTELLSPFKGEGIRRKVEGSVEEVGNRYRIKLHVWVETNQELDQPLSSAEAKWKNKRADATAARVLLAQIEKLLLQSGVFTVTDSAS